MTCDEIVRRLDAFIDDELDADLARAVRDHVSVCRVCRRRVEEREALSRLLRSAPYYPAPAGLHARVSARATRAASMHRMLTWAAAAVLVLSLGGGVVFVRSGATREDTTVANLVDSHVRSLMADHVFDVRSTDQHTVKPWFLGKLDFAPPVVDPAAAGFPLVGGRLDYVGGRPAAALVYERRKHIINVFVVPAETKADAAPAVESLRGFHVHHWIRNGMSFWAVSDLNDAELTEFVGLVQAAS